MDKCTPFFIVGSDRSGTTLLRLMVNEHSVLHVPRESQFMVDLFAELPLDKALSNKEKAKAFNIIVQNERWKDLEISDSDLSGKIKQLEQPSLKDIIEAVFKISAGRAGKQCWGDKTPDYIKEIQHLHIVFPDARFIHVIRDGRDVCLSLLKRRWIGTWVPNIARYWSDCVKSGIAAGRMLPEEQYMEVRYEELVLNSERVLRRVCNFLGVEFEKQMLEFHKKAAQNIAPWESDLHRKTMRPPRKEDIYRWEREANPLIVGSFEAIAGNTMDMVGQKRKYQGARKIFPWCLKGLERLFRVLLTIRRKIINGFSTNKQYMDEKNQQLS